MLDLFSELPAPWAKLCREQGTVFAWAHDGDKPHGDWIELKSGGELLTKWGEGMWSPALGDSQRLELRFGSACHVCELVDGDIFEVVQRLRLKTGKELSHPIRGGVQVVSRGWPIDSRPAISRQVKRPAPSTPEKVRNPKRRLRAADEGGLIMEHGKAGISAAERVFGGTWTITVNGQVWGKAHVSSKKCFFKTADGIRIPFSIQGDGSGLSPFGIPDGSGVARLEHCSRSNVREWRLATGGKSVWNLDEKASCQEMYEVDVDQTASPMSRCLTRALAALRPGAAKGRLVGREREQADIKQFLSDGVCSGGRSQVLYVSGMPGTGKTASVLETVASLQRESESGGCPPFTFVHVNGLCLGSPSGVFPEVLHQIQCHKKTTEQRVTKSCNGAYEELTRQLAGSAQGEKTIVLLLDEIDSLVTKGQTVLYQLFDWLSIPDVRLALVAIANTIDLPERLLPRISSRLGILRVNFATYERAQLRDIIDDRLYLANAEDAFKSDALELCAARVASAHGDARKALQVCRRAIEVQLEECSADELGPITVRQLAAAEESLLRVNPSSKAIEALSLKARRLLLAVVLEAKRCDNLLIPLRDAMRRYVGIMTTCDRRELGNTHPDLMDGTAQARHTDDANFMVQRLEAMSLLRVHCTGTWHEEAAGCTGTARMDACVQEIMLGLGDTLDVDDVADALSGCHEDDMVGELLHNH